MRLQLISTRDGAGERWIVVQEYAPPKTIEPRAARQRRNEALAVIPHVLEIPAERMRVRERRQQKEGAQYEKVAHEREFELVRERPYRFAVNFSDYLDTGLFLDHRLTRRRIGELAHGTTISQSVRLHGDSDRLCGGRRCGVIDDRGHVANLHRVGEAQSCAERPRGSAARIRAGRLPHVARGATDKPRRWDSDVHRSADAFALEAHERRLRCAARSCAGC